MYLKALYIQGFKSFAKKTKIEFNSSITGIVGPNGSGKSNISDAINWVLGQTSVKALRGKKMEDVIFSGTDNKKPLGFAEVTIIFDNSDGTLDIEYTEVSVSRRMYRSGESDFRINENKCRLKDIRELFMDTGIGRDGYSLIGQGKIEQVLSDKPEDRRAIFEEAAGVTKYKYRKSESENKLKNTEDNLNRIEDILSELKSRERELYEESEKALKYNSLLDEIEYLDINLKYIDLEKLRSKEVEIVEKYEKARDEVKDLEKNLESLNSNLEVESQKLIEEKNAFEALKEKSNNLSRELGELKNSNTILERDLKYAKDESIKNNSALLELRESREKYSSEIKTLEEKNSSLDIKITELKNLSEEYKKREDILLGEINELNNQLDQHRLDRENKTLALTKKNSQMETLNSLITEKSTRLTNLKKTETQFLENEAQYKSSIEKYNGEIENLGNLWEENSQKKQEVLNNLEKSNIKLNEGRKNLQELQRRLDEKNTKLKLLKNLQENFEGYSFGVKSFMQRSIRENLFRENLIGPVGEHFRTEKKYEVAINTAIGFGLQNIIVRNASGVSQMIEFLRRHNLGRVTFSPIDNVNYFKNDPIENYRNYGAIDYAVNLIEFDQELAPVFYNILGNTIIVSEYDQALKISRLSKQKLRVVTLNGDILNRGGSITGGTQKSSKSPVLNRSREIEEINLEMKNLEDRISKGTKYLNDLQVEIDSLSEIEGELKATEQALFEKRVSLENKVEGLNNGLQNNSTYLEKYQSEIEELTISIKDEKEKLNSLKGELRDYTTETIDDSEVKDKLELKERDRNSLLEIITNLKIDLGKYQVEWDNSKKSLENLKSDEKLNASKINSIVEGIKISEENIENLNHEIIKNNEKIFNLENKLEEFEKQLTTHVKAIDKLNISIETLENNRKSHEKNLLHGDRLHMKLESQLEKQRFVIENLLEYIGERYGDKKLEDEVDSNFDSTGASTKLKELQIELESLGEVNLLSINKHREVKERLEFNLKQRNDLAGSIEKIKEIIKNLDLEMKNIFKNSFEKISKNFDEIFKILFNGGRGEITLDGTVLEGGIDIKVQPPGKKMQSLNLYSGGERALTAVALLFALLKERPAPFCILDEIDAALDESNISRYLDYLKTIEGIQFIIITHRKLTMEIADVLYGITMQEKGISSVISLELREVENVKLV